MRNPFWFRNYEEPPPGYINMDYIHWYYHQSWRAPFFWLKRKWRRR